MIVSHILTPVSQHYLQALSSHKKLSPTLKQTMCLSNNNSRSATKHSNSMSKPSRPYTEYNLFFQLEREHILQIQLGFEPDYEPQDVFDPSDTTNYQGPPLPSRYNELIYLNDWHLPGKEKRRNRRHRKTHGRIGFQELSLKIADAWKTVDSETRVFCAELCEIGRVQYRAAMRSYKAMNSGQVATVPSQVKPASGNEEHRAIISSDGGQVQALPAPELPPVVPCSMNFVPTGSYSLDEVDTAFKNEVVLPNVFHDEAATDATSQSGFVTAGSVFEESSSVNSMVDIDDDAIIDMYKSSVAGSKAEEVVSEVNIPPFSNVLNGANTFSSSPYYQTASVDANMDAAMVLLNQQIQMQSNIIASMKAALAGNRYSESMKPQMPLSTQDCP